MKILRKTFVVAGCILAVFVGFVLFTALRQELQLSCRPNCAGADLSKVSLYRPYPLGDPEMAMLSISMRDVDFHEADFSQTNLHGVMVRHCDFRQADFHQANLHQTDFAWSYLENADFRDAYMFKVNLHSADLRGADLRNADLSQAFMTEANLAGADLTGADLTGANLTNIHYDDTTKWPEGFNSERVGAILSQNGK